MSTSKRTGKDKARIVTLIIQRGLAQAVVFITTLFAAKYISPQEFGTAGLFTSLCSFFAMASSSRFEVRAIVSQSNETRSAYFGMAYASNILWLIGGTVLACAFYFIGQLPAWIWLIPIGIALSSTVQFVLPAQHSSLENISRLGWMTQIVAAVLSAAQIAAALIHPVAISLIAARVLAWFLGVLFMFSSVASGLKQAVNFKEKRTTNLIKSSRLEITYGVPAAVISVATLQVPVYIYTLYSMQAEVGIYWLAFNFMFVPYLIVSSSLRPIFLRHISESQKAQSPYERLRKLTIICLFSGIVAAGLVGGLCALASQHLLDSNWSQTGPFALALSPLLATLIAQSPISFSISAFGLQRLNFINGIAQTAIRALVMFVTIELTHSALYAITSFSLISATLYIIYIYTCLKHLKSKSVVPTHRNSND